ncbi:DUF2996 domain-containing protein [Thermoleptolyngbya sp. C42_A2020_037]|uniref:DUF2996 domain-containing protein n=1 Tax=Thermoleptolyngbya sp. C42_A2020_037 TaxID=2747799 RepID=UPI0019F76B95|nr:DUF2996 domain-containing protein [Thermoleptolyngbya sp. C42_A2020_037]
MPDEATNPPAEAASTTEGQPTPASAAPAEAPAETKPPREPKVQSADGEAPAAKPKKEKPPALEDKPFADFITQDYMPSLKQAMAAAGFNDLDLKFEKLPLPIKGMEELGACWQVQGKFQGGQHQFLVGFVKEDIQGQKVFSCAGNGASPSLLESFMIDERKVTLDLMVLYTLQRLNGQKWLVGN